MVGLTPRNFHLTTLISISKSNDYHILVLALASTVQPTSIFICSVNLNDDGSDRFEIDIVDCLDYHEQSILSLDWENVNMKTNDTENHGRIVSCGEDCRIYIWQFNIKSRLWSPSLVLLNKSCATLCCKWNSTGEYVALGMGGNHQSATLQLCTFHKETGEWVSRSVGRREIKSSVLYLSWRPNGSNIENFLASGGCDFKCRIFDVANNTGEGR